MANFAESPHFSVRLLDDPTFSKVHRCVRFEKRLSDYIAAAASGDLTLEDLRNGKARELQIAQADEIALVAPWAQKFAIYQRSIYLSAISYIAIGGAGDRTRSERCRFINSSRATYNSATSDLQAFEQSWLSGSTSNNEMIDIARSKIEDVSEILFGDGHESIEEIHRRKLLRQLVESQMLQCAADVAGEQAVGSSRARASILCLVRTALRPKFGTPLEIESQHY